MSKVEARVYRLDAAGGAQHGGASKSSIAREEVETTIVMVARDGL